MYFDFINAQFPEITRIDIVLYLLNQKLGWIPEHNLISFVKICEERSMTEIRRVCSSSYF